MIGENRCRDVYKYYIYVYIYVIIIIEKIINLKDKDEYILEGLYRGKGILEW